MSSCQFLSHKDGIPVYQSITVIRTKEHSNNFMHRIMNGIKILREIGFVIGCECFWSPI